MRKSFNITTTVTAPWIFRHLQLVRWRDEAQRNLAGDSCLHK